MRREALTRQNGDMCMNAKLLLPIIAATLLPLAAYAHDCSGGTADGGMDATGNQCNAEIVTPVASPARAVAATIALTKAESKKTPLKRRIGMRDASVRTRTKQG